MNKLQLQHSWNLDHTTSPPQRCPPVAWCTVSPFHSFTVVVQDFLNILYSSITALTIAKRSLRLLLSSGPRVHGTSATPPLRLGLLQP